MSKIASITKTAFETAAPKATNVLPPPSAELIKEYLGNWDDFEDYRLQENALDYLFITLCPENKNISEILLKVSVLNDFYSTNIFKVYPVAKHILSLHIDERLQDRDITLVDDIKKIEIGGKKRSLYSFATKYCSHHRPLDYPIYDSYVDRVLCHYRREDGFAVFKNNELKDYTIFKSILDKFRQFYHLEECSLKDLDKYLWQIGKDYFNKYIN